MGARKGETEASTSRRYSCKGNGLMIGKKGNQFFFRACRRSIALLVFSEINFQLLVSRKANYKLSDSSYVIL